MKSVESKSSRVITNKGKWIPVDLTPIPVASQFPVKKVIHPADWEVNTFFPDSSVRATKSAG